MANIIRAAARAFHRMDGWPEDTDPIDLARDLRIGEFGAMQFAESVATSTKSDALTVLVVLTAWAEELEAGGGWPSISALDYADGLHAFGSTVAAVFDRLAEVERRRDAV